MARDIKTCGCGEGIWDYPQGRRPSFAASILCPGCGADHSVAPSWFWRLRYGLRRLRLWKRLFGFAYMRRHYHRAFLLPREYPEYVPIRPSKADVFTGAAIDGLNPPDFLRLPPNWNADPRLQEAQQP
ncbi:MAG: hypothetical protein Q8R28_11250 [Dehalococcoidia bacterium]|nr:hypothetical protein [Dehalococcoidia bacterium]